MTKKPVQPQDKYVLRMPDGLRDRIKAQGERNGRSMNAEILQALGQYFPPEPTIEEVLDAVHRSIELSKTPNSLPYRKHLIESLDALAERLSSGIEFDQFRSSTNPFGNSGASELVARLHRWRRAGQSGIEQSDLERELKAGLLDHIGGDIAHSALSMFNEGKLERGMQILRLAHLKFEDRDAAIKAIEAHLRQFFINNWGDPDQPWGDDD